MNAIPLVSKPGFQIPFLQTSFVNFCFFLRAILNFYRRKEIIKAFIQINHHDNHLFGRKISKILILRFLISSRHPFDQTNKPTNNSENKYIEGRIESRGGGGALIDIRGREFRRKPAITRDRGCK